MAALVILVGGFLVSRAFKEKEVSVPEKTSPQTLEEFAEKKGLTMDAYPAELLELYERNPETKDFVWEYPFKKDEEPEIDLSEYKNSASMPLFMPVGVENTALLLVYLFAVVRKCAVKRTS